MTMTLLPADAPVLSALVFLPLAAAAVTAALKDELAIRRTALIAGLLECLLLLSLLGFKNDVVGFQFVESHQWMPAFGMTYALGVDGLSLLLVALSALLLPLCVLCSWTYIGSRVKEFHVCLLLMISACVGVFTALDFVLFYIFWEAMLIPMYLLIAV